MTLDNLSNAAAPRTVMALPIASIAVPAARIGFYDADHSARLGADIAANGQHDPIHVKKNGNAAKLPWTLVAGLHRYRGVELLGGTSIYAIQVADASASADELRRLELSENLDHRQRRPIERAIFMVERARMEEAIDHPGRVGEPSHLRALRVRQSTGDTMSPVENWLQRTAAAMNCGPRQLQRYERIHRNIVEALPDVAEQLNFHPLGEQFEAMNKLAGFPDVSRRQVANAILSRSTWKNIKEVLIFIEVERSNGFRAAPTDRARTQIVSSFAKLEAAQKCDVVLELSKDIPPSFVPEIIRSLSVMLP